MKVIRRFAGVLPEILSLQRLDIWTLTLGRLQEPAAPKANADVTFALADREILRAMVDDGQLGILPSQLPFYAQFLGQGNRLMVGFVNETIVSYAAIRVAGKTIGRRRFALEPAEFFVQACFTRAQYRGRGINSLLLQRLCDIAREHQYRLGYMEINRHNRASARNASKAGWSKSPSYYLRMRVLYRNIIVPRGPLKCRFV